jgi:hypothetical protein
MNGLESDPFPSCSLCMLDSAMTWPTVQILLAQPSSPAIARVDSVLYRPLPEASMFDQKSLERWLLHNDGAFPSERHDDMCASLLWDSQRGLHGGRVVEHM